MRNKSGVTIAILLGVSLLLSCKSTMIGLPCPKVLYDELQARQLAGNRLLKFCESKNIECANFAPTAVVAGKDLPWTVDSETPKVAPGYYFFRVTIDQCGFVETSWQFYLIEK